MSIDLQNSGYRAYVDALEGSIDHTGILSREEFRSNTSLGTFHHRDRGLVQIDDALGEYHRLRADLIRRKSQGHLIEYYPSVRNYLASLENIITASAVWGEVAPGVTPSAIVSTTGSDIRSEVKLMLEIAADELAAIRSEIKPSWQFN